MNAHVVTTSLIGPETLAGTTDFGGVGWKSKGLLYDLDLSCYSFCYSLPAFLETAKPRRP